MQCYICKTDNFRYACDSCDKYICDKCTIKCLLWPDYCSSNIYLCKLCIENNNFRNPNDTFIPTDYVTILLQKIKKIEEQLYIPGGPAYQEAKKHFEMLQQK